MDEQLAERLATAVSTLIAHFKVGPEGASYEDLSLTDAAVISWIAQAGASGRAPIQKEIGGSLGLPKTTMTSAIKRLSARGLVQQLSGETDARARTLHLTFEGRRLASNLRQAQVRASMAILQTLPAPDHDRLVDLLEKVVAAVPSRATAS